MSSTETVEPPSRSAIDRSTDGLGAPSSSILMSSPACSSARISAATCARSSSMSWSSPTVHSGGRPTSSGSALAMRWKKPSMVPTCMRCSSLHSATSTPWYSAAVAVPTTTSNFARALAPDSSSAAPSAAFARMRARISPAALRVKVTARTRDGLGSRPARSSSMHQAMMRLARVKVLPEPALAITIERGALMRHLRPDRRCRLLIRSQIRPQIQDRPLRW